ncbi:MAG: Gfo/Idh/MocA family oxidoreductase [Candidatus Brockarchaeota archaeon]|nr:Gfo/Idh/MocA family oxidoreductase [Candidatus Brockarchaeota archaeon]
MGKGMLKLAIVGCGGMAGEHLRAYGSIKEKEPSKFEFSAMCAPAIDSAKRFSEFAARCQGFKPRVYSSVQDMLQKEQLDAADICTPHSEHHVAGIACLNAGVNVMIEKPFGVTIKASKAIIEAARRNGKIAATAENVRRGLSQRTANWILNGEKLLGKPRLFYAQQVEREDPSIVRDWHWRVDKWLGGGGMVMDSGAHFCDTIRYLYGDPDTVYAKVQQLERWPHRKGGSIVMDDREDTWMATISFKSGVVGFWSWTMAAPGYAFTNVVHYGSGGCILDHGDAFHGPFSNAEIVQVEGPKKIVTPMSEMQRRFLAQLGERERNALFPHGFTDGVAIECYDFLDAVEKGRKPEVDGETGMKAKAICEAIYESAYAGRAVRYEDVLSGKVEEYQRPINERWNL